MAERDVVSRVAELADQIAQKLIQAKQGGPRHRRIKLVEGGRRQYGVADAGVELSGWVLQLVGWGWWGLPGNRG